MLEYSYPLLALLVLYFFYKRWYTWTTKREREMVGVREEFLDSFRDREPSECIDLAKRMGIQFIEFERISDGGQNGFCGKRFEVIIPPRLMLSVGPQALGRFLGTILDYYSMTDSDMKRCLLRLAMKLVDLFGDHEVNDQLLPSVRTRSVPVAVDLETEVTRVVTRRRGRARKIVRDLSDEMAVKAFKEVGIKIS